MGNAKEMFMSTDAHETRVAVTEEKRLEEFYVERERRLQALTEGRIRIQLRHQPRARGGELVISVEDSGPGFDYMNWDKNNPGLTAKSGRGITLLRSLCEEIVYRGNGNCVEATYVWESE